MALVVWGWDGYVVELWRGEDALEALTAAENARREHAHHPRRMDCTIQIADEDNPERGDVTLDLEDAVADMPRMPLGVPR